MNTISGRSDRDILPMTVANMTFLVNRLGEDCAPLQFVRELTQNALDALGGLDGSVCWDVDWPLFQHTGYRKLACIDTGQGMTGEQMVLFINELSSSIHQQSASGNYGVGAKIAAAPRNPHGLVYKSWVGGVGHMIHLWFDPQRQIYGLRRWPDNGGEFWTPIADDLKPKEIGDHGTMVTLLGLDDDDDTMIPPAGTPSKSRWVLRYLNTRYFDFPSGTTVKTREGWELPVGNRHNFMREVEGQGPWLDRHSEAAGTVPLSTGDARWWVLREAADRDSGHFAPGGHVAALHQGELYELVAGRGGITRLQSFGVIFGTDRVVIYVQPRGTAKKGITTNTARTHLIHGAEALDWAGWAAEFRENMPDAIKQLQDEISSRGSEKDHKKAIRERLRQIQDLLRFQRFKPAENGRVTVDPEDPAPGGMHEHQERHTSRDAPTGGSGGKAGALYAMFAVAGVVDAKPIDAFTEPSTRWVSVKDQTRDPLDMEGRAGKFIRAQNLLIINADFRVFTDMVDRWAYVYQSTPGAAPVVREVVHEWFEQQLVEVVMSAQALKDAESWSSHELETLCDEAALSAAVLPRWHIEQNVKRSLGGRLGLAR